MTNATCPLCSAAWESVVSCQEVFDRFLVLEFTDPEFGAVHFLTVACFYIQHNRYSDEGLAWIQDKLRACLEGGATADEIRRLASLDAGNEKRTRKVTRQPGARLLPKTPWSMTIVDVDHGAQDADTYRALIVRWARSVLSEMAPLIK